PSPLRGGSPDGTKHGGFSDGLFRRKNNRRTWAGGSSRRGFLEPPRRVRDRRARAREGRAREERRRFARAAGRGRGASSAVVASAMLSGGGRSPRAPSRRVRRADLA